MSLATLSGSLIVRLGALALDCLCCVLCNGAACQFNSDCSEGCSCVQGQCRDSCQSDEDCPEGYVCVNGACVPACQGDPCAETAECSLGCSCVDGQCWPNSDLFYCVWETAPQTQADPNCDPASAECEMRPMTRQEIFECESDPACEGSLPARNCQRGKPNDESLIHDGPFITYAECCGRDCKCLYRCEGDTSCAPWPTGQYQDELECNAACGDPEDIGACCEIRKIRDDNDNIFRYERGPITNPDGTLAPCPTPRWACVSEEDKQRSFRPTITDCSLCPVTQFGACCTDDGCIDESQQEPGSPIDPFECEQVLGGVFRPEWVDCRQHRDPAVNTEFACDDCNGRWDCDCDMADHCVNRQCVPCLDQVIEIPLVAGLHDTAIAVAAGDDVAIIAKRCDSLEWGQTIRSQIGNDGAPRTSAGSDTFLADEDGTLLVRLERQGAPAAGQLCVQVTPPPPGGCCLVCERLPEEGANGCPEGFIPVDGMCQRLYDTECGPEGEAATAVLCEADGGFAAFVIPGPCDDPLP